MDCWLTLTLSLSQQKKNRSVRNGQGVPHQLKSKEIRGWLPCYFWKKEQLKKNKAEKTFGILQNCKDHGCPLTPNTQDTLSNLHEKQLLLIRKSHNWDKLLPKYQTNEACQDWWHIQDGAIHYTEELKTSIGNALRLEDNIPNDICNWMLYNLVLEDDLRALI